MLLQGKAAIVTGAGRGIGNTVASLFASQGAKVVVHYQNSAKAADLLAMEVAGVAIRADLRIPSDVDNLVQEALAAFGRIDFLINTAASFKHSTSFEDETWSDYIEEYDGVFGTTYRLTRAVVPIMKEQQFGRIVNFGATLIQRPTPGFGAHISAKAAVLSFTQGLARELGRYNITVNAISPGMTQTDFTNSLSKEERNKVAGVTPLRRLATAADVANVCLFYCSDLGSFVTGANIAPDGGLVIL